MLLYLSGSVWICSVQSSLAVVSTSPRCHQHSVDIYTKGWLVVWNLNYY